jgi:hypothetical protein
MNPARVASTMIMAGMLAACSDHPIETGRSVYVSPRMPVRTLVETPPAATVPLPPTPQLRPGSVAGLEQLRAGGDADAELLGADTPPDNSAGGNATTADAPGDAPAGTVNATQGSTTGTAPATTGTAAAATTTTNGAAAAPTTAAPAPVVDSVTVASTDDDPDHLVGLSEADALRLLGKPKTRADTPPSRVWTYSSTSCELRLFFYPEIGGTSYRTLTYEIDDHDPTDTNRRACVGGLLKNHAS